MERRFFIRKRFKATPKVVWSGLIATLLTFASCLELHAQGGAPPVDSFDYYSPGACVEAVKRSDAFYWRTTPDTVQFSMERDTMLTVSAELAATCAKQFSLEELNQRDLILLATVFLAAGDDESAQRAVERRIQLASGESIGIRAKVLQDVVEAYLSSSPARVDKAMSYLKQLDEMAGEEAALARFNAHFAAQRYFWRAGNDSGLREQSEAAIAAAQEMSSRDRTEFGVYMGEVYKLLSQAEGSRTGTSDAPRAIVDRARKDFTDLSYGNAMMEKPDTIASMYGRKGARVQADYWMGSPGDTVRPAASKFTIIVFRLNRTSVAALQRLQKRFGDKVAVTGLVTTKGYFRDEGPLTIKEELDLLRKYYIEELEMPGVIAVSETKFTTMPDGRRRAPLDPTSHAYWTPAGTVAIVLDDQGIIRQVFTDTWRPWYESRMAEFIEGAI